MTKPIAFRSFSRFYTITNTRSRTRDAAVGWLRFQPSRGLSASCYAKGHRECGEGTLLTLAPDADRLQWVRNGLTLTTADDYNSKVLSERGGAGQRVGYTKTGPRASPNRITTDHERTRDHIYANALRTLDTGQSSDSHITPLHPASLVLYRPVTYVSSHFTLSSAQMLGAGSPRSKGALWVPWSAAGAASS